MTDPMQPIFILPEDTKRTQGKSAQSMNIEAAKLVAQTVRTTLGPKGMDKMLVDNTGDVIVTNDGVTILEEMHIEHPTAKMIVEVAKTQDSEVGDGTTTAVVLAGELLKEAERLLTQKIHPTVIAKGYRLAAEKAQIVLNEIAENLSTDSREQLQMLAMTAMTGKGAEAAKEALCKIVVEAVTRVIEEQNGEIILNKENIAFETQPGSVEKSILVEGIILDKEKVHPQMPTLIQEPKIALLDCPLEIRTTEIDAKISITDPEKLQAFIDMEEQMLSKMVSKIAATNATTVFCQKGIDDMAQHYLAQHNIYAVRRVRKSDLERLARATKAKIISNIDDLKPEHLGSSGTVREILVGEEAMTAVTGCKDAKAVTILVKGGTEHVAAEIKRALVDAIGDVSSALKNKKIIAGAAAAEIEVASALKKYARSFSGREQLAVTAFANAMEVIPTTLAENSGLDPIDVLTELKSAHEQNQKWAGINVFTGKIMDAFQEGIIEPLSIKTQAISSASEVAIMILRIDDVIATSQMPPQKNPVE